MAKMMKSRRLRKRVRKTLGALFLASAIAVAAIPVDDLEASTGAGGTLGVTLTEYGSGKDTDSTIPKIKTDERVYATGDGVFQFAYVNPNPNQAGGNKVAVLLGYSSSGHTLEGGNLTIPDTVDVYAKYTDTQGSAEGYVAVGRNLHFLFWKQDTPVRDADGNPTYEQKLDDVWFYVLMDGREKEMSLWTVADGARRPKQAVDKDGNPVYEEDGVTPVYVKDPNGNVVYETVQRKVYVNDLTKPIVTSEYLPCYYNTKDIAGGWGELDWDEFYALNMDKDGKVNVTYNKKDDEGKIFHLTTDDSEQWIIDVSVEYIGNQTVDGEGKIGDWITAADVEAGTIRGGVFARQGNIVNLKVGPNLRGIGDYAFYYCTGLQSITLSNNLETIGNHAFDSCLNMKEITVDTNCNMNRIGDHAFYNCQSLQSFVMPTPVEAIGDGAFENCVALSSVELYSPNRVTALTTIGDHAFKNCRSLTRLVIPNNVTGNGSYAAGNSNKGSKLRLGMVEGCTALQSITLMNENADFAEDASGTYGFKEFTAQMPDTFYFEGVNTANSNNEPRKDTLHYTANQHSIAFKYLGSDVYEIVKMDENGHKAIYRVNSSNELIYCQIEDGMKDIDMPSTIGPYNIRAISSTSFQHNCFLEKVKIPSSVQTIASNAFLGCHNLKDVIFESPVQCQIGANAFKTQDATIHQAGCPIGSVTGNGQLSTTPELTFTGDISYASGPFDYAMNPSNNINVGAQERTYIKYYSGWPTNLTVQYNPNTDKNELIDYPILEDLSSYKMDSYPYMTEEYLSAAQAVVNKLKSGGRLTDYEQQIADSALNIVLPQGIESVKENLFVEKEAKETQNVEKSITTNSIAEILPETFKGCKNLKTLNIFGDTSSIGDYAFEGCEKLATVEISANVNHMGLRPFADCPNVAYVSFQGGPNFVCEDSIIYGLNGGNKSTVVECLESRGNVSGATSVKAEELAGITGIAEEAFYNCSGVGSVDLTQSGIDKVPSYAFAASEGRNSTLYSVYLPKTCKQIQKNAFKNSAVRYVEIPGSVSYIDLDAFNTDRNSPRDAVDEDDGIVRESRHSIDFYCEPDSAANIYASNHENINISDKPIELEFTVTFGVVNPTDFMDVQILDTQTVKGGEDAVAPTPPEYEGYTFQGWYPDYHEVARDLDVKAFYKANNPEDSKLTVTFMDEDGVTELGTDSVFPGDDAKPPVAPDKDGYRFIGWVPAYTNITMDTTVYARYERVDSDEAKYTVRFFAWNEETGRNDKLISTQRIALGETYTDPKMEERSNYRFTGWWPDVSEITGDVDTYAQYEYAGPGSPTPTPDPDATPAPTATPIPGATATPNPNQTPNPNATATPAPAPGATATPAPGIYTLTVRNGSGSGSYIEGAQVIAIADNPPNNSEFSGWTVEPATAVVASKDAMGTVLIMPASNVTMTANYKAKTGTGSSTVTRPSGSTGSGTGTSTGSSNGTTVVINKNGLSNTGVVSVTVNGSSDNFVVKISEDANATDAALRALMSEYSDMSKIAYFPMDISLYDSTGTNKITDTLGLAVNITLPIPDSLIPYAGNNKVASVVNGQLDKLTPKFTTISGVPCISFTATHFSPYVIYVDTSNLTEAAIRDDTPKTGDGIHPKWFLAMGLACISFVLFIKKDKRPVPVKVAAAR